MVAVAVALGTWNSARKAEALSCLGLRINIEIKKIYIYRIEYFLSGCYRKIGNNIVYFGVPEKELASFYFSPPDSQLVSLILANWWGGEWDPRVCGSRQDNGHADRNASWPATRFPFFSPIIFC